MPRAEEYKEEDKPTNNSLITKIERSTRMLMIMMGFPDGSEGNESTAGLILGSGKSPGRENGNPFQYFCLKKIPWTEEPGRLQSTKSQSHKESDKTG